MNKKTDAILRKLSEIAQNPKQSVLALMRRTGKKAIGCFPVYSVEELIHAAGMLPIGMWGAQTDFLHADKYLPAFACSIMKENLELAMRGAYDMLSAVTISSLCDTFKCTMANWHTVLGDKIPVVPLMFPHNRKTQNGVDYLIRELRSIQTRLTEISQKTVTDADLADSMAIYEASRQALREFVALCNDYPVTVDAKIRHLVIKASYFMDRGEYLETLNELNAELKAQPKEDADVVKVVLTGIIAEPDGLLNLLTDNRMRVVADDLAQESRQFRTPARPGLRAIEQMAYRISDQVGCPLLFEEQKSRGRMLIDLAKNNKAHGVIVVLLKFCDPEEYDYPICKAELEAAGIPHLMIEIDHNAKNFETLRTRIQSFAEILQ
ncbi:MAG: 2-hydroxyacyl-CoA dehydratase family protein [Clostridiales Family XIII bacterium]|jgi:benzoyl-CoA reductase/2-hydroxyglutaryl-CoA dehydratase subunit BcrC/BadD/HgdB|nr:2-hydroxyacyl-CoA dehydratase family protein [Clostridiales Family XIII bacterium]